MRMATSAMQRNGNFLSTKVSKPEGRSPAHQMEFDHAELKEIKQPTADEMMEAMGIWKNEYLNAGHKQVMLKVLKEKGRFFHENLTF